jgi:hypothetical protein
VKRKCLPGSAYGELRIGFSMTTVFMKLFSGKNPPNCPLTRIQNIAIIITININCIFTLSLGGVGIVGADREGLAAG